MLHQRAGREEGSKGAVGSIWVSTHTRAGPAGIKSEVCYTETVEE